jgi:hypothetical protein
MIILTHMIHWVYRFQLYQPIFKFEAHFRGLVQLLDGPTWPIPIPQC